MSQETTEWLNANVLMGFVEDREKWATQGFVNAGGGDDGSLMRPWFADDTYSGGFVGPVPIDAIMERLFHWEAIEGQLSARVPAGSIHTADGIGEDGNPYRNIVLPDRKAILRSDNFHDMGVFKDGYRIHQYREWLIDNVASIVDDDVQVDSALQLMGGAVAAVSVSMPESLQTSAGFAIRPRILSFTSMNGKHSTTYMRSLAAPVCDNSLQVEVDSADKKQRVKIKHSANSGVKIADAREALGILFAAAEEDIAFFDALAAWEVSSKDFMSVLDTLDPMPEKVMDGAKVKNQRALTITDTRRMEVVKMYVQDPRAAQWKGTALGVLQAFNTYDQQERQVNGMRVERQMLGTLEGKVGAYDKLVLGTLEGVTGQSVRELVGAGAN